jgi:hypothetical protein
MFHTNHKQIVQCKCKCGVAVDDNSTEIKEERQMRANKAKE